MPGQARRVVDLVEERLWTPLGLRTLDPADPGYVPHYVGASERDAAYHRGTAWPWLAGPFIEAWVRVRGNSPEARARRRAKFVQPLLDRLDAGWTGTFSRNRRRRCSSHAARLPVPGVVAGRIDSRPIATRANDR